MRGLIRDLCGFQTGVVADQNQALFDRIEQELPLELFRFPSGVTHNGWIVPNNWRVRRANVVKDGKLVFDGTANALGVAVHSRSFVGELDWDELRPHLVTNAHLPSAYMYHCMWQYRPWDANWSLSVPYEQFERLGPGRYRIDLETEEEPGHMLVAHHHKPGRSDKTIVFNAHTCHPHMANDGFAGVAVLIRLMQWLRAQDTFYSYRLVFGPEHLGTVFYLRDRSREDVDRLVGGIFQEMPSTGAPLKAASTFSGGHLIDRAFANVLCHHATAHVRVPWRMGAGNDETVWESPGYEVPFVEFTRCEDQFAPYTEYHTSLDSHELMDAEQVDEVLGVLKRVVGVLEDDRVIHRRFDGLLCLANPQYGLYMERPDPAVNKVLAHDSEKWGHLLDCLLRYMEGEHTILDIAEQHGLPFDALHRYLIRFLDKDLITFQRREIQRVRPRRVAPDAFANATP